jgi:hypothetical protein
VPGQTGGAIAAVWTRLVCGRESSSLRCRRRVRRSTEISTFRRSARGTPTATEAAGRHAASARLWSFRPHSGPSRPLAAPAWHRAGGRHRVSPSAWGWISGMRGPPTACAVLGRLPHPIGEGRARSRRRVSRCRVRSGCTERRYRCRRRNSRPPRWCRRRWRLRARPASLHPVRRCPARPHWRRGQPTARPSVKPATPHDQAGGCSPCWSCPAIRHRPEIGVCPGVFAVGSNARPVVGGRGGE